MRKNTFFLATTIALLMVCGPAFAQVGIFDSQADWGDDQSPPIRGTYKAAGSASVSGDIYTLQGNGDDIWENNDEGFFVYSERSGSFSLSANVNWDYRGGDSEWAKAGVMFRENGPSATSRHYWIELRAGTDVDNMGDSAAAQWRLADGGGSASADAPSIDEEAVRDRGDGLWLRVSRIADAGIVVSQYSFDGINWNYGHTQAMSFPDTIAYGLAITNHMDNEDLAKALFTDVTVEEAVPAAGFRTMGSEDPVYITGDPVSVSITVGGGSGDITFEETPPAGWEISDVSDGGSVSGGTITWTVSGATTVSYVVTPGADSTGAVTFSGAVGDIPISGANTLSSPEPVGIFDHHLDVGDVGAAGAAEYSEDDERYYVTGSGADVWGNADEFHFVYKKLSGAFSLEGLAFAYNDTGANEWSKAGVMVRDNLTAGSAHLMGIFRGSDGQYDTQWRISQDGGSSDTGLKAEVTGDVRLEKFGKTIQAYYMDGNGEWVLDTEQTLELTDPVYVGYISCSHDDGLTAVGEFDYTNLTLYPFQILKDISTTEVKQGESFDVSVRAEFREGVSTSLAIEETYSAGVAISNLSADMGDVTDDGNGTINWTVSADSGAATLQFTVNVPSDYAPSFVDIVGSYDDGAGNSGVTGSTSLAVEAVDLGIFQGHSDIGDVGAPGNVKVEDESYQVVGSGADIWGSADSFHYLWMKADGDFTFSVEEPYIGSYGANPSSNDWQKMGIMVRQELTAPSTYVIALLRASDQALTLQWRDESGTDATSDEVYTNASEWNPNYDAALSEGVNQPTLDQYNVGGALKMTREGDLFTLYYTYDGEDWYQNAHELAMTDPVYLGIAVTAHESGSTAQGLFTNPEFDGDVVSVKTWMLY